MNDKDILGGTGTLVTEPSSKNPYDEVEALTARYNGIRGESIVNARAFATSSRDIQEVIACAKRGIRVWERSSGQGIRITSLEPLASLA
jgi:hypothetical protein